MITINMNTARWKLTVEGHAQPAESEQYREICAGASALAQSLAYACTKYNEGDGTMKSFEYRPDSGNLKIRVYPETWAESAFRHIFNNYSWGFQLLAESHPYSVTFIKDGERVIAPKAKED